MIRSAKEAYPATRFCSTPSPSPPANASGTDAKRPMTAAVADTNRNRVKSCADSPSSGVASTPASPARPDAIIQATDDSRSALIPRSSVSERSSTAARSRSPSRVCRSSTHRATATSAVATQVISWSESMPTLRELPGPRGARPHARQPELVLRRFHGRARVRQELHRPQSGRRQRHQQPDGGDDLGALPDPGQPAEHQPVQRPAEAGCEYQDDQQRRRDGGPAQPGVHLVEDQRTQVGRGPVREVEQPGGRVREHEPGGEQCVQGAGDQAAQGDDEQILHAAPLTRAT